MRTIDGDYCVLFRHFPISFDNKLALYECTRNTTLCPHIGAFLAALEDYTLCIPTPRCFTASI